MKTITYFTLIFVLLLSFCKEKATDKENKEAGIEKKPDLILENAWIKETPMDQMNSAAFLNIENNSNNPIKLLSVESDISETVELHETIYENEVMKMQMVENIVIPPKSVLELKPGSLHVMFINIKRDLKEGENISLALNFETIGKKSVMAKVKKHESMMQHEHHNH
ncbi:MAG: copper chaperone PCu(A)C [Leptospiraceae bacterium]|nr:copper chaperone PCu(A)C [Leptospiraceae bacterium]MCP5496450.1 copper chaperone PCu(A)C [Leptospiraceae bacterium]